MADFSICLPYYINPGMLALHYAEWAPWPDDLKRHFEIVIVDDGSPSGRAADVPRPPGLPALSIYRVAEDIPWHQDGARNLSAHVAQGEWLLLTDMDHVLTQKSARALCGCLNAATIKKGHIYTLARVDAATGLPTRSRDGRLKPHQNSYVVSRDTYWQIGGYDESLSGYRTTDGIFRWRAERKATLGHLTDVTLLRFRAKEISDATTQTLPRTKSADEPELWLRKFRALKRGVEAPVPVLQFAWERVV